VSDTWYKWRRRRGWHGRQRGVVAQLLLGFGQVGVLRVGGRDHRLREGRLVAALVREGEWGLLRRSMSAGVTYWVPEIHWMLLIVGRGGMRRSGLSNMSFVRSLDDVSMINIRKKYRHLQLQSCSEDVY
jgi:hypothetical protein